MPLPSSSTPRHLAEPLRVLVVHNRYQYRGGEDTVVEAEVDLLRSHGHPVETYFRSNDDVAGIGKLQLAAQTLWSRRTIKDFDRIAERFAPDIVHVHNTLPLISPSVYWAAHRRGIPIVQTLHNFRLLCPQAMLLRAGQVCEDCVGRFPWPGIRHGCYRGSTAQTAMVASTVELHRRLGTWQDKVSTYIALNDFCRDKFIEGGLPAEKIVVKPNFIDAPPPKDLPRSGFLFVGRLSKEKGIHVLAEALSLCPEGVHCRVAGTGPDEALIAGHPRVTMLGALNSAQVLDEMQRAVALVVPSIWYENFPRTIVEAYACGLPVIASDIGALADIVTHDTTGYLFPVNSPSALSETLRRTSSNPQRLKSLGRAVRQLYERELDKDQNYRILTAIYHSLRKIDGAVVSP
jgi:glycosyltransferase involved in cell wall biosynthesis